MLLLCGRESRRTEEKVHYLAVKVYLPAITVCGGRDGLSRAKGHLQKKKDMTGRKDPVSRDEHYREVGGWGIKKVFDRGDWTARCSLNVVVSW